MDKYVGKRLDGRYEVKEIIGVGGMAVVYKAYDSIDDRIVAIKILREEFISNEDFTRRFKNESKAIAILSHPNIVKVYDVSFGDRLQYIVMEYINGITLKQYIEQQGKVKWNEAVHFTTQILLALDHAHKKGIIHRDIKPQNIILLSDGTIKVTDFGIARFSQNQQRTMTDKAIGSVHYISPEQARGDHTDEKADLYSVGVILYEMLTGALPFESDSAVSVAIMQLQSNPKSLKELNSDVPDGLEDITLKAMQKDVAKRYQSAYEMLKDLMIFKEDPTVRFKNNFYIDEQPTKYVESVKQSNNITANSEDPEEEPRKVIPILTAIAGSALAVVCIFVVWSVLSSGLIGGGKSYDVECPKLIGLNYYTEVQTNKEYEKFNITETPNTEFNSEYANGIIIKQDPEPGRMIKNTNKISVTISKGPQTFTVPDVFNMDARSAQTMLESKGLKVEVSFKYDDTVTKDYVVSTKPENGATVQNGETITMFVSQGPPNSYVRVPYLINLMADDAKIRISESSLTVGDTIEKASTKPKGVVLSQDVPPNSQVAEGSVINITVSSGEKPKNDTELQIDLPNDERIVTLNLFQDGSSVYEKKVKLKNMGIVRIPVSGTGKSSFEVTFTGDGMNGFEYMTFDFDFDTGNYSRVRVNELPKPSTEPTTQVIATTAPPLSTAPTTQPTSFYGYD